MKKALMIAAGLLCAASVSLNAATAPKKQLTTEQKQVRKEMIQKYDENKDGKLSVEETAKITTEDKEKYQKAGVLPAAAKKKAQ
jgi:hypothetical protein